MATWFLTKIPKVRLIFPKQGRADNGEQQSEEESQRTRIQRLMDATSLDLPAPPTKAVEKVIDPEASPATTTATATAPPAAAPEEVEKEKTTAAVQSDDDPNSRFVVVEHGKTGDLEIFELTISDDPVDRAKSLEGFLVGITTTRSRAELILTREKTAAQTRSQ